jgi:hypothetical protein
MGFGNSARPAIHEFTEAQRFGFTDPAKRINFDRG